MGRKNKMDAAATIVMLVAVVSAAAAACDDEISQLTPCYSYIDEESNRPASDCCSHLGDVAASKPECLCQLLHSDINLNKTRIMDLPKACNVTTPPPSLCNSSRSSSGYSTKISNSLRLSLIAASYSSILIFI